MSELMKQAKNYGVQSLVVNPKGKNIIRRSAYCPTHNKRSSHYQGAEDRGWIFRCDWNGHIFYVLPDPHAPKTTEDIKKWEADQMQKRVDQLSQRGQQ